MVETGILTREDHVELIHGEIVQMAPIGRRHCAATAALNALLVRGLGDRVVVVPQGSLPLPPRSMPEPDLMVLQPRRDFYRDVDLSAGDVLLLIEVSETSVRHDRLVKVPLYAAAGIREVWVVDAEGGAIETYREPAADGYRSSERFPRGMTVSPEAFPELTLVVSDIVG